MIFLQFFQRTSLFLSFKQSEMLILIFIYSGIFILFTEFNLARIIFYKEGKYRRIQIAMKALIILLNALDKRTSQQLRSQKMLLHISFSRKIILKLLIFLAWMNGKPCKRWILGKGQNLFSNQAVKINRYGSYYMNHIIETLSYGP